MTNSPADTPIETKTSRQKDWGWPFVWLSVLLVFGGTAAGAFFWLITMPPPIDCKQISPLSPEMQRLQCAKESASSRKVEELIKGLAVVKDWPEDNPLYPQASQLRDEWSKWLLELARNKLESGDLKGAEELAKKIPANASVYQDAQAVVSTWQTDWDKGKTIYNKAQEALKQQQWQLATGYAQQLASLRNEYWGQQRSADLLNQIGRERQAWEQLKLARVTANPQTADNLQKALQLATKVEEKTYAHNTAKTDITKWSRKVLQIASVQIKQRNLPAAINLANSIPSISSLYAEAQDFILLSKAEMLLPKEKEFSGPVARHVFALIEAQAAARQLSQDRPLYKQAQEKIASWQAQLDDLVQLEVASSAASFGQGWMLQMAIEQANTISRNRPRRVHAQTLIAQWRKELKESEDRPYLVRAQTLAQAKTVDSYKTAIAEARQIKLNRPLRLEAQTLIASWNKQIETIEDKPILEESLALAKQNKLDAAIRTASRIGKGRALYKEAIAAISDWTAEIQITEDRPLLNEAAKLASVGRLSEAIQKAAQIGSGRALYYEAQDAIARWAAERNTIRLSSYPEPAQESAPTQSYSPPPVESYSPPPAESYSPPPAESYSPPAPEPYSPPAPEPYYPPAAPEPAPPPVESYTPPAPEPYYPPAAPEPYIPPEPAPEPYVPPVQSYEPPVEPAPAPEPAPPEPAPVAAPEPAPAAAPLPADGIE
ncbi:hypothetical protein NG798_21285 [Ancylothrix sp. C2]|uniref:hypothetical protein n=1 Tax=Ancylothrix sp. D3o TaxID=2953691 RepID=UPI0021BA4929|nr:hypothetical protein [Ancylothrix sp. D3o]MCT7952333.1 hypothetical protein [Ancylothrix sp. D3o]